MKKYCILFCFFTFLASIPIVIAENYRVFFNDKGNISFTQSSLEQYYKSKYGESSTNRMLTRRAKVGKKFLIPEDAPIFQPYKDSITRRGIRISLELWWENYVVIQSDSTAAFELQKFPFVRKVQRTSGKLIPLCSQAATDPYEPSTFQSNAFATSPCNTFSYGRSFQQNSSVNADKLHEYGITGNGVVLGLLDAGFRWKFHETLKNSSVIAEYDFINTDSITANENSQDRDDQDAHGTLVMSVACGYWKDSLVGVAPSVQLLLAKTEYVPTERRIEEDNYAAGIEWLERMGADITSSSLGYFTYDSTETPYTYKELDGNTTICSRAINRAVTRGIVCLTAAGNAGDSPNTIQSPGDADSVITVAASRITEQRAAKFSSRGPRGDGKRKPDIAAQGIRVLCASTSGSDSLSWAQGTSLATPIMAGCASLLLSQFPEARPWEIRNALFQTASQSTQPDDTLGYGVADVFAASRFLGIVSSPELAWIPWNNSIRVYVKCSSSQPLSGKLFVEYNNKVYELDAFYSSALSCLYADLPNEVFSDTTSPAKCADVRMEIVSGTTTKILKKSICPKTQYAPIGMSVCLFPTYVAESENLLPNSRVYIENQSLVLQIQTENSEEFSIQVVNILGSVLFQSRFETAGAGRHFQTLPIDSYPSGRYFVVLNSSTQGTKVFPCTIIR